MVDRAPPIVLHTPYYADPGDGCLVHRYLDEQFLPRFIQEARDGGLSAAATQQWRRADRFGPQAQDLPNLRLPLHRTFYVVCCEASCELPGAPAVDPRRIASAGLVIRRGQPQRHQRWMVRDGTPQGWRTPRADAPLAGEFEPEEFRRLRHLGVALEAPALYSGEATYPLHPLVVERTTATGHRRRHTLLFGYLPLGGSSPVPGEDQPAAQGGPPTASGHLLELEWPFGCRDGQPLSTTPEAEPPLDCGRFRWTQRTGLQLSGGRPTRAFAGLLRLLVERYHIQDAALPANRALRRQLRELRFFERLPTPRPDLPGDLPTQGHPAAGDLLDYLDHHFEALLAWLTRHAQDADRHPLPERPADLLYVGERQAAALRELMAIRAETAERMLADSLPVPRFQQRREDIYYVQPFVRFTDRCARERIHWGPPSPCFRVAAPLDPEASRPTAIQMPEFSDLKRGMARGLSFLTPRSLADKIFSVKPDTRFEGGGPGNRWPFCAGLSLSFSLPVITFVAMLLLMIVVGLLNLVFFWLPWVFITLPRLCRR